MTSLARVTGAVREELAQVIVALWYDIDHHGGVEASGYFTADAELRFKNAAFTPVLDFGCAENHLYMVMPHIPGISLQTRLRENRLCSPIAAFCRSSSLPFSRSCRSIWWPKTSPHPNPQSSLSQTISSAPTQPSTQAMQPFKPEV